MDISERSFNLARSRQANIEEQFDSLELSALLRSVLVDPDELNQELRQSRQNFSQSVLNSNQSIVHRSKQEQLRLQMNDQCALCFNSYDEGAYQPMMICKKNQHVCCKYCVKHLFENSATIPCPMCRDPINKKDASVFRLYSEYLRKLQSLHKSIKEKCNQLELLKIQLQSRKKQFLTDLQTMRVDCALQKEIFATKELQYFMERNQVLQSNQNLQTKIKRLIKQLQLKKLDNQNLQNKIQQLTSLYKTTEEGKQKMIISYQVKNSKLEKQNRQLQLEKELLQVDYSNRSTILLDQNKKLSNKLKKSLKITDIPRWQMQGQQLFRMGRCEVATEIFIHLIQMSVEKQCEIYGLGCIEDIRGYYQNRQEQLYFELIDKEKMKFNPFDALSMCFLKKRNFQIAQQWYNKMLKTSQNNPFLLFGLANTLYNLSLFEQAEKTYRKVISLKPNFDKPYQLIASIYYNSGLKQNNSSAIIFCNDSLNLNPKNVYSKLMLAVLQEDQSKKQKMLLKLIQDKPLFIRAKSALASYYISIKNSEMGIKLSKECISANPYYDRSYLNIGFLLQTKEIYKQATQKYLECIKTNPLNQNAYLSLAKLYFKLGKWDWAIQKIEETLQNNPHFQKAIQFLAKIYFRKGNLTQSIQCYEKCSKLVRKNDKYFQIIGDIYYFNLINHKKAKQYYQKCRSVNPQNLQASCQLKNISYHSEINVGRKTLDL